MPKPGFKSITISDAVYDRFFDVYSKNREKMMMRGVSSFAGYVTYMMEETMQKDKTFARYAPRMESISVEDDRVILKDNIEDRIAEITIRGGKFFCQLCEQEHCVHVGFAFSLPEVYEALAARGMNKRG
ncbi:hypothetical protein CENSYa_0404 [Cenarchaeum symbiosum A]|uniref:Uncharacterized protein n=1 Tax=Cenarchaeum symbiosum (strain A) TaxID=414004 RepID=A0RUM3_CENSY|nr:hypothetical protein CENSYa_0404 [Cenarchaeum symbiosum A]